MPPVLAVPVLLVPVLVVPALLAPALAPLLTRETVRLLLALESLDPLPVEPAWLRLCFVW